MKQDALILSILIMIPVLVLVSQLYFDESLYRILISLILSCYGGLVTYQLIPVFMPMTEKSGLWGKDLCKKGTDREDVHVPESLGVVVGTVLVLIIIIMQIIYGKTQEDIATFSSACLSICFMVLLGFVDDVIELRWRYKLVLPALACLPLVQGYIFQHGSTIIVLPEFLGHLLGSSSTSVSLLGKFVSFFFTVDGEPFGTYIDLSYCYYIYILMLSIFCTNAINIYAGINGLEVGQSIIIAASILLMNLYEIYIGGESPYVQNHLFSAVILLPFLALSLALFAYNSYPAKCFVGDVYTYTAGVTFAVVGIFGHFSKSLLLFFLPQVINFIYSLPQLLSFLPFSIPCPRHRLPRYDAKMKKLIPSIYKEDDTKSDKSEKKLNATEYHPPKYINHTLINLVLYYIGPCTERKLTFILLFIQICCSILAFTVRLYYQNKYGQTL
ncbi:hypothetical protein WA158_007391 [Blastocystis sp. Blastoise]